MDWRTADPFFFLMIAFSERGRCVHDCGAIMSREVNTMPRIIPIRDLRNTSNISKMAHDSQEPIFVTKNGYSDLVVMSAELYETIVQNDRIDRAISDAEAERDRGGSLISLDAARTRSDGKYRRKIRRSPLSKGISRSRRNLRMYFERLVGTRLCPDANSNPNRGTISPP